MKAYVSYKYNGNDILDYRTYESWFIISDVQVSENGYLKHSSMQKILDAALDVVKDEYNVDAENTFSITKQDIVITNIVVLSDE